MIETEYAKPRFPQKANNSLVAVKCVEKEMMFAFCGGGWGPGVIFLGNFVLLGLLIESTGYLGGTTKKHVFPSSVCYCCTFPIGKTEGEY